MFVSGCSKKQSNVESATEPQCLHSLGKSICENGLLKLSLHIKLKLEKVFYTLQKNYRHKHGWKRLENPFLAMFFPVSEINCSKQVDYWSSQLGERSTLVKRGLPVGGQKQSSQYENFTWCLTNEVTINWHCKTTSCIKDLFYLPKCRYLCSTE